MFSRYKKSTAAAAGRGVVDAAPQATAPEPVRAAPLRKPLPTTSARPAASDKELKRKDRLAELKLQLHRELLDHLNLAALEHASEKDLRAEISDITTETLSSMGVVLNREERSTLVTELYDEVTRPLVPLRRCSRTKRSAIFW